MITKSFKNFKNTFRFLIPFLKENRINYFLGIIFLLGADILQLIMPKVLGILTDKLQSYQLNQNDFIYYIAIIFSVAIGVAICRFSWRMFIFGSSRKLEFSLRELLFKHLETLSQTFYHNSTTGDLMAHATNDIQAVRMAFGGGIVMAVDAFFLTLSTIFMMAININLTLTLIALIPLPIIAILIGLFGPKVQNRFKNVQEAFSQLTNKVQENFSGIRVIKSFVQEKNVNNDFCDVNDLNLRKNMNLVKLFGFMMPMVTFVSSLSFIVALSLGGYMVINLQITLGQFVSFVTYLGLLTWPMMAIGFVVNILQRGMASMKRINKILETLPEVTDRDADFSINTFDGTLEYKNVSFSYPNSDFPALENISFKLDAGKTLAIVGRTGSGKTTLVNLLLRRFTDYNGSITIDQTPIEHYPLKILTKSIGYVPQSVFLFSTSIEDNLNFAGLNTTSDSMEKACSNAMILDEINRLPNGFNTILGEKGVNLSGGQKQRLSIARALIKKPRILILDDSLSAVDTNTEEQILYHLNMNTNGSSTILIAHRLSTLQNADHIIVLDEGKIIQSGNHEQLVTRNGLYKDLYEKQQLEDILSKEV